MSSSTPGNRHTAAAVLSSSAVMAAGTVVSRMSGLVRGILLAAIHRCRNALNGSVLKDDINGFVVERRGRIQDDQVAKQHGGRKYRKGAVG